MSLDIELVGAAGYWRNITHNLGRMAAECGLYKPMWRPDEHGYRHARDLIQPLYEGIGVLISDPARFKAFNPENGWGRYENLVEAACEYLAACVAEPDAEVRVSR